MNCRERLIKPDHLTSNLLPHYLAKFEHLTVWLYRCSSIVCGW